MRRYVQILGLVVLALSASGWGVVVAAVLCPHANGSSALKMGVAGSPTLDEACHSVKPEPVASEHCHDSDTKQEAVAVNESGTKTPDASTPAKTDGNALGLPHGVPCTHCLSRPEVPSSTVLARQQSPQKRILGLAKLPAATAVVPAPSFAKPVLYRQGAPPGSSIPKHLLTGILLI